MPVVEHSSERINMIQVMIEPAGFAYAGTTDMHGGKMVHIRISQDVVDAVNWVMEHRAKLAKEEELRRSNPALASAWDQYQVMMRLVMDDL